MEGISLVYEKSLGHLSLFGETSDNKPRQKFHLERPVTPINDEIKRAPTVFAQLIDYIRRRVEPHDCDADLELEEQESLAAVLLAEVSYIWPELRMQPQIPFLTVTQNEELQRRTVVHIVTVCQVLFNKYLRKLDVLNRRGIFTSSANIVRLKAQLADDAHRFLDIRTIRRHILEDVRHGDVENKDDSSEYSLTFIEETPPQLDTKSRLSFTDLINASRPHIPSTKKPCTVVSEVIPRMMAEMPNLDLNKVNSSIGASVSTDANLTKREVQEMATESKIIHKDKSIEVGQLSKNTGLEKVQRLKRSKSLTELSQRDTASGEFEVSRLSREDRSGLWHGHTGLKQEDSKQNPEPAKSSGVSQHFSNDLQKLTTCETLTTSDDDIPPLLQFLHSNTRSEARREQLEQKLKQLEEREKARKEKEQLIREKNLHAQPSYVTKKMHGKFPVRTSDIRVSNRICLSSVTLGKHPVLYNHLSNEIDEETIKKLDANLFLKEEMADVFEEIMKTMPSDHLQPESDAYVEPGPDSGITRTRFSAINALQKPKNRIFNRRLRQDTNSRKSVEFPHDPFSEGDHHEDDEELHHQLLSKSVGSWLTWWKNTVNSDDYMKYLSTQETDYLGMLFRFYNSDDEDEEEIQKEKERKLEIETKMNTMLSQKKKYEPGLWNANSVLLGGLGQKPVLQQEKDASTSVAEKDGVMVSKSASVVQRKAGRDCSKELKPKSIEAESSSRNSYLSNAQERLETVWTSLQMSDSQKLDMAVKYSFDAYYEVLNEAIHDWESATDLITKREKILVELETFERLASNPTRLLGRASNASRQMNETRTRETFNKKLSDIEVKLCDILDQIENLYHDVVTYQGRPYKEKMKEDRTEMLFWLQEERKRKMLERECLAKHLPSLPQSLIKIHPVSVGDRLLTQDTSSQP